MKSIFNQQLEYGTDEMLGTLMDNLNPQFAIKIIELGIEKGLSQGMYSLVESHCLYKSIQYLKTLEKIEKNNEQRGE